MKILFVSTDLGKVGVYGLESLPWFEELTEQRKAVILYSDLIFAKMDNKIRCLFQPNWVEHRGSDEIDLYYSSPGLF